MIRERANAGWRTVASAMLLLAILGVPLGISAKRMTEAEARMQTADAGLEHAVRDVRELLDLRSRQERISLQERPPQDVIAMVTAVLAEIGLPASHLRSLAPESDGLIESPSAGASKDRSRVKRQSLRLTLENMAVQDLGAFLLHWHQSQSIWTVTRLELTHVRNSTAGNDNRYDISILISALYLDSA